MDSKAVSVEEALTMTGFGRYNVMAVVLAGMMVTGVAAEISSLAYLIPGSACELQTTPEQQGLMAGLPVLGVLLATNIWGYYGDTRGRRKMLIIAMIMGFVSGCAASFSPNWMVFIFFKFVSNASMAGIYGLSTALLSECTPVKHRSMLVMLVTSMYALFSGCMAVISIPVLPLKFSYYIPYLDIHFNSWRLLNIIYSSFCAIGAVCGYFSFSSPKCLLSIGQEEKAMEILRKMYMINSGKDGSYYKVSAVILEEGDSRVVSDVGVWRSVINQTIPLFKPPLLRHTLLLATLFIAVYFCINPFVKWFPFMMDGFMKSLAKGDTGLTFCQMLRSSQNNTNPTEDLKENDCALNPAAMLLVFGTYMSLAVVNVFFSFLLPCVRRKTMFIMLQLIFGSASLLVNSSTIWQLTAVLIMTNILGMFSYGLLNTFSVDMLPTYVKAMGVCFSMMVGRGSAAFGVHLLKYLLTYHCEVNFYVFGSVSIAGGLLGFLLPFDKKISQKQIEEPTQIINDK